MRFAGDRPVWGGTRARTAQHRQESPEGGSSSTGPEADGTGTSWRWLTAGLGPVASVGGGSGARSQEGHGRMVRPEDRLLITGTRTGRVQPEMNGLRRHGTSSTEDGPRRPVLAGRPQLLPSSPRASVSRLCCWSGKGAGYSTVRWLLSQVFRLATRQTDSHATTRK